MTSHKDRPSVIGVAEAVLYVSDLDRAENFYARVLGLPLTLWITDARFFQTGAASTRWP